MESDGPPPPPPPSNAAVEPETLDPAAAHRKHTAMLQRLTDLHHSRLQQSAARRADPHSASPAFESVAAFLDRFSASKSSISAALARCRSLAAEDPTSKPHFKPELDKVSASIADLEQLLAENSYFLPSYEVRSSLKAVTDLKDSLDAATAELLPRKKFSFRNKPTHRDPPASLPQESNLPSAERPDLASVRDSPGFRNKKDAVLVKKFSGNGGGGGEGEFTLADLTSCDVYLKGRLRSLFVNRLRDCRVFVGPVLGSTLIDEVDGCLFMLASHQIRIHRAGATDFYLRVRSRPIIEDTSGVRFAPYRLFYEGIDDELRDSGLAEETGNWANVDDFKWLRAVQSPNWCVMHEEEHVDTMVVTDLEEQGNDT